MRRREFVGLVGGAVAWPLTVRPLLAQAPPGKIGYVHPVTISPNHTTFGILRTEWQRLGYVEGETFLPRSGDGNPDRLSAVIHDLIEKNVGVLVVVGAEAVRVAAKTSKTTPIVAIDLETDPVNAGLVASFARPGGNVTGLFLDLPLLATKWIELMREAIPGLERIAFAWQPSTGRNQLDVGLEAARLLGVEAVVLETETADDFASTLSRLAGSKRTGIILLTAPGVGASAPNYAAAAQSRGLATMSFLGVGARSGILMSYGPKQEEYFPRAILVADRILRGARVGDLPIERPTRFEFILNLKTAAALGIAVPPMLLARADEVIE